MHPTAALQPQRCVAARAASAVARVQFRVPKRVSFGQSLSMVTSKSGWQPDPCLKMQWSEGDQWNVSAELDPEEGLEYKYVVLGPHGIVEWQSGDNRRLAVEVPSGGSVTVQDEWHGAGHQVSVIAPELKPAPAPIGKPTGNMATSFFGKARLPASLQRGLLNFQAPRAVQAAASQAPALADLSKKQLKALLQEKGLPTDGRKLELLERLEKAA